MSNPFRYKIVEYSRTFPYGTSNSIVASAATLKGCMAEYQRHLARFAGERRRNIVATKILFEGQALDVIPCQA